jgi:hypothetical protein
LWLNSRTLVVVAAVVDGLLRWAVLRPGQEQRLMVHLQLQVETVHHRLLVVLYVQAHKQTEALDQHYKEV